MRAATPRARVRVRDRTGARAGTALLVSLLANGLVLAALGRAGAFRPAAAREAAAIALEPVGAADWEARRQIGGGAPPAPVARPTAAVPAPAPEVPAGSAVRVAPSPDPRRPARARFLAERDNSVERETQWRGQRSRDAALAARRISGEAGVQGIPVPGEAGSADQSAPGREGAPTPGKEARIARARVAVAPRDDAGAAARAGAGDGGARRAGRFDPRVLPVGDAFAAVGGGAPSGERLPGVASGDATLVNTRQFKFASFYGRVHDAIAGEWDPNRAWDARDPQDRLLGRERRKVLVDIVLDPEGRLRDARLVRGSGLDFFDRECLRAIAAAAPFPNPPRGLVGQDGLVLLRGWGLVFEWGPDALLDRVLPRR